MRARVTFLLMLGVLMGIPDASAEQLDARDQPTVTGPLTLVTRKCGGRPEKEGGVIIAVVRSCVRFYRFDINQENSTLRDFGAVWLQTSVDTRRGWCATVVKSDILTPAGARLLRRRPRLARLAHRKIHLTRLVVDAAGHAFSNGTISKRFVLYPRLMRGVTRNLGAYFRTAWYGSTDRKVSFASGAEISWPAGAAPTNVSSRLSYRIRRKGNC